MKITIDKKSFLDEFTTVRSVENHKAKDRSEGFVYLHEKTTKSIANGEGFSMHNIDFTMFTYDDLLEYADYYRTVVEPKITLANSMFKAVTEAKSLFTPTKNYF